MDKKTHVLCFREESYCRPEIQAIIYYRRKTIISKMANESFFDTISLIMDDFN